MNKILRPIEKQSKLLNEQFYVFDVETNGLRARPDAFIFGVIYGFFESPDNIQRIQSKVIYSVDDFKKEFEHKRYSGKKIFAHNAEYDLTVIYDNIYDMDNKAIFNNRFISATNGNCNFVDSMNILPSSVKNIGNSIGLPKLGIEDEYIKGKVTKITEKMIKYCERDCEIIFKALSNIFNNVGCLKITIGSLALEMFRRNYLKFPIESNKYGDYFFNSYYGGRVECFKLGNVKAVSYDINSHYPYAMLVTRFPNPKYFKKIDKNIDPDKFINYFLQRYEGCAKIKVNHKFNFFGFLPYRENGKILFPIGTFEGTWNFNEIRFALKHKVIKILNVYEIIYSKPLTNPFTEYVNELYNDRQTSDNEFNVFQLKLFLNCLYGKFAQRIKEEFIYIKDVKKQIDEVIKIVKSKNYLRTVPLDTEGKRCFLVIKNRKFRTLNHSIPCFSSYITSQSRIYLLEKLLKYKNYKPVYCDTDSIFFEIDPNINESNKLGSFKKEKKLVTEIRGLKNYSYLCDNKSIDKIKGIPKKAKKIEFNIYEYESLVKTRESLIRKLDAGILLTRIKNLSHTYDKRIILKNNLTLPIKL